MRINTYSQQYFSKNFIIMNNSFELFNRKFSIFSPICYKTPTYSLSKILNTDFDYSFQQKNDLLYSSFKILGFETVKLSKTYKKNIQQFSFLSMQRTNSNVWSIFTNEDSLSSTTTFLFSIVQKRFLFTKNLLLSKMLFFDNRNSRKQPPSPPSSSIFMPSINYENFKRTENDFQFKARFSMNEKIQFHQQQRFLKQLYNMPVQQYFHSELVQKRHTFFANAFQEIAYIDSFTTRSSSIHFYQRKYLGLKHRFSNINQWWTGFLPEHNTESTYLSDVDWRTMFISKNNQIHSLKNQKKQKQQKLLNNNLLMNNTLEFTMDFPDAEHYYNPRNRRWYFQSNSLKTSTQNSSYWLNFHTNLQYEIYYHFFMQSFHETYEYFNKNREIFDFFVFSLLKTGSLKEFDYLTTNLRFPQS